MILMNRYLTDEELENTGEGNLLSKVSVSVSEAIKVGVLEGCKVVKPLITDDENLLEAVNSKLGVDAKIMYYIPVIGTESNFMQEAYNLKPLIDILSKEFEGCVFEDGKFLMCVNAVSLLGEKKPNPVHNIVFMMRELPEDIDLDDIPDYTYTSESETDTDLVS